MARKLEQYAERKKVTKLEELKALKERLIEDNKRIVKSAWTYSSC